MKNAFFWRGVAAAASMLLLSCVPPEAEDNPSIELPEAPFDVSISLEVSQKDAMSRFVRRGDVVGAEICDDCKPGYFAVMPFDEPDQAVIRVVHKAGAIEVVPQRHDVATTTHYHRYSFVDESGYTNSAVARYHPVERQPPIRVFHDPVSEHATHLEFTMIFPEPIKESADIEIIYPGNNKWAGDIQLGRNNFISSYLDAVGQQEVTFLIELNEADEEAEGIEFAPVSVTLPGEEESTLIKFQGIILDDDADNTLAPQGAPVPHQLERVGSCPLNQQDRLGSGGDLRFSLEWENPQTDFNLWVKDPCDNIHNQLSSAHQCESHTSSRESSEGRERPSENMVWPAGAQIGDYSFAVEHFSGPESAFSLCVYRDGIVEGYRGVAGGGAISVPQTVTVTDGDTGRYLPAQATRVETPDFVYTGEIADSLPIVDFSVDPVTVVQTVDGDDPRAELQFQFDVLNLTNRCQGQLLKAFITDEEGNRTETLVIGSNTYTKELSEGRGSTVQAYIPPSSLIELPLNELVSRNWNIDIPLEYSARTYDIELSFVIESSFAQDYYVECVSPEYAATIKSVEFSVDAPGFADLELMEGGGPEVRFIYPYATRLTEGVIYNQYVNDTVYTQYESLPATESPADVELHINRELYRRGLPFSVEESLDIEFSGWFVMHGVDIDFGSYHAPIEVRYMYPREFPLETNNGNRSVPYRLAFSGRADILALFSHGEIQVKRETLIYHDGSWEWNRASAAFDESSGIALPTVVHFSDPEGLFEASGSVANDVYHVGSDAGDGRSGGALWIHFLDEATKGFDVLSFSDQVDVENFDYYRNGKDLWILKSDFFELDWVQNLVDQYEGDLAAVLDEIHGRYEYSAYEHPHFRVTIENYFGDRLGLIDEFRWKNQPYITHEEIVARATEL